MTSREITFRAKIKGENTWYYGIPIETHLGTFIVFEDNPHYCSMYGYMEIDELGLIQEDTLGQFTGIRDKNGKKVYEGDIVLQKGYSGKNEPMLVRFRSGAFIVGYHKGSSTKTSPMLLNEKCEVIGNIYDNPKLLEE